MQFVLKFAMAALVSFAAVSCCGQVAVDGAYGGDEAAYGDARSVQNTNTGYGNSTNGDPKAAKSGSEIDQVFASVRHDRLYVLVAGNLEDNFNKLNVFIDSVPGGVNQIAGANLPAQVDPYCCAGSGALQRFSGFRFDAGFEADHFLTFSNGNHTFGSPPITRWTLSAYYADLTQGAAGNKSEIGFQRNASGVEPGLALGEPIDQLNNNCMGPADTNCMPPEHEFAEPIDLVNDPTNTRNHRNFLNDVGLLMAINNSNTQGVNSGTGPATGNPASVLTGLEFSLPLAVLGNPTADIKIAAFIGNGGHSHVSNQFAGVGPLSANLGTPASINLAAIPGNQFITVTPPSADFDHDGDVDGHDFLAWQRGAGDADANGVVDGTDFTIWKQQFAAADSLPTTPTVPEPTSFTLLLPIVAILAHLAHRRPPAPARPPASLPRQRASRVSGGRQVARSPRVLLLCTRLVVPATQPVTQSISS
jgi:hypothetical protein